MMCPQTFCRHEPADWIELVKHQQLEKIPRVIIPTKDLLIGTLVTFGWYLTTVSCDGKSFVLSRNGEKVEIDHTGRDS